MTEQEWLESTEPQQMLEFLHGKASEVTARTDRIELRARHVARQIYVNSNCDS